MTGILGGLIGTYGLSDPGAMELIATETLATSSTTFTIANVPSTYRHLQIRFQSRTISSTNMLMRVNNLSTTIYSSVNLLTYKGSTETGNSFTNQNAFTLAAETVTTSASAGLWGTGILDLYDYTGSYGRKLFMSQYGYSGFSNYSGGQVTLAAPITSVTIFAGTTIAIGSSISIYGIKG